MLIRTVAFGLLTSAVAVSLASAAHAQKPDPKTIGINSFTASGAGCAPGTVVADISEDREAITLAFSNFQISASGISKRVFELSNATSCVVNLELRVPPGYAMNLNYVDSRGYLALPGRGATSTLKMEFGVSGSGIWVDSSRGIWNVGATMSGFSQVGLVDFKAKSGPYNGDFQQVTTINARQYEQASCSRTGKLVLGLKTTMQLQNYERSGALFTIDTQDAAVVKRIGVTYVKCRR